MKRLALLVGIGIGFVMGSRAGRGAYDQIEAKFRELTGKPAVRDVVDQVSGAVKEQTSAAKDKVMDKLPSGDSNGSKTEASSGASRG